MLGIEGFGGCTLNEYHGYLLKLLKEIDRICRKNDILYFLIYGSLIGAVRHHGFIPWDDDADIIMTRRNFNKFKECCKAELGEEFDLVSCMDDEQYSYTFPRLRMKNTTYIIRSEISRHGRNAGFFIDIILMDEIPKSKFRAHIQQRASMAYHRLASPGFFQSGIGLNRAEDLLVSISKALLGRKRSLRNAEKLIVAKKSEKTDKLLAQIFMPKAGYFYIYDSYHFDSSNDVPFEDTMLSVPHDPIEFLHKCYYREYIENNTLLEYKYSDEIEAIRQGKCHHANDIMFIIPDRSREQHLEVVFDCEHGSSYYDSIYLSKFDKKQNDKCAVKERRMRETHRKVLNVMGATEKVAKQTCINIMLRDYLKDVIEKFPDPLAIPFEAAAEAVEKVIVYGTELSDDFSQDQFLYIIRLLCRLGYCFNAECVLKKFKNAYQNINYSVEETWLKAQEEAVYAVYEQDISAMEKYLEYGYDDIFSEEIRGILLYHKKQYDEAESILLNCRKMFASAFWANYYLGVLALRRDEKSAARGYLTDALNCTNFMPLLQLVLDRIKEIDHAVCC